MSSVSSLYRRYLLVCSQWSVDTTKTGRDFGTHLRQQITKLFPNSELTQINSNDLKLLDQRIQSLERLNKNVYFRPVFFESSASGLTADQCKQVLSTETLEYLEQTSHLSLFSRIKATFGAIPFLKRDKTEDTKESDQLK